MSFQERNNKESHPQNLNGNDLFEATQSQRCRRRFVMIEVGGGMNENWQELQKTNPSASIVMNEILRNIGQHNAVCASQKTLAELTGYSVRTVQRAVKILRENRWIQVVQLNGKGDVLCYIVNDRVAWFGKRKNLKFTKFSATVLASSKDQEEEIKGSLKKIQSLMTTTPMSEGGDNND